MQLVKSLNGHRTGSDIKTSDKYRLKLTNYFWKLLKMRKQINFSWTNYLLSKTHSFFYLHKNNLKRSRKTDICRRDGEGAFQEQTRHNTTLRSNCREDFLYFFFKEKKYFFRTWLVGIGCFLYLQNNWEGDWELRVENWEISVENWEWENVKCQQALN